MDRKLIPSKTSKSRSKGAIGYSGKHFDIQAPFLQNYTSRFLLFIASDGVQLKRTFFNQELFA